MRVAIVGGIMFAISGLIHLYLGKRLVWDTLPPGRPRKIGLGVIIGLATLVPATLISTRAGVSWLAWPGYLWVAVMFYLLVGLVLLEVPLLVARLVWRRRGAEAGRRGEVTAEHADVAVASRQGEAGAEQADAAAASRQGEAGVEQADVAVASRQVEAGAEQPDVAVASRLGGNSASRNPAHNASASTTRSRAGAEESGDAGAERRGGEGRGTARGVEEKGGAGGGEAGAVAGATVTGQGGRSAGLGEGLGVPTDGFDRRVLLSRGAAVFAGLTAVGVTGYGVRTALAPPRIDRVRVPIAKLPRRLDGLRIATVSDIHLGPLRQRAHTARIVEIINGLDADVVAVVGDLVDGTVEELGPAAAPLADLRSRHGSFFVTGNHEYFSGVEGWLDELPRLGLRLLQNERVEIDGIDLAGVNDVTAPEPWAPDYAAALGDRDPARPVVLLAHQPAAAFNIADYDVDLQLSGHTHGGQMVPFNLVVGLVQPVVSGLGEVDGTPVYVTNGAGFWGPPVRVGAPPQVTLVELRAP